MSQESSEILIFISHRHDDKKIADVINSHLQLWGIPEKSIYQSSADTGGGSRFGEPLDENLTDALYQAKAVLLVYTFADQDWSYCMYECGLATDPKKLNNTKIVVFQTTEDIPKVYQGHIRVRITPKDIYKFTEQFHKDEEFLPGQSALFPDTAAATLQRRSQDFYRELSKVIPIETARESYRWDFFTLKLDVDSLIRIREQQSVDNQLNAIQEESEVVFHFGEALKHFGFDVWRNPKLKFNQLVNRWKKTIVEQENVDQENIPQEWIKGLCQEMLRAINNVPAKPTWELMKSIHYLDWWFYPIVNHVRVNPDRSMEFQIYMYRIPGTLPNQPA